MSDLEPPFNGDPEVGPEPPSTFDILRELLPLHGFDVDDVMLNLVASDVSIDAERDSAPVTWELWDEESPINGVSADDIKTRTDYAGGAVYLIYIHGALAVLQPHAPTAGLTAMTPAEAAYWAELHTQDLLEGVARQSLLAKVVRRLEAAGMNATP